MGKCAGRENQNRRDRQQARNKLSLQFLGGLDCVSRFGLEVERTNSGGLPAKIKLTVREVDTAGVPADFLFLPPLRVSFEKETLDNFVLP